MYIRTRLTLWFLLIVLLLLATFSVTIYQLTKSNLLAMIDQDVRHQAAILQVAIHPCPGTATLCVPPLDVFKSPDTFLQVQDQHGTILARSGNLWKWRLPLLPATIAANQVQEVLVEHTPFFVYGQPVVINHRVLGYIIVAHSPRPFIWR